MNTFKWMKRTDTVGRDVSGSPGLWSSTDTVQADVAQEMYELLEELRDFLENDLSSHSQELAGRVKETLAYAQAGQR